MLRQYKVIADGAALRRARWKNVARFSPMALACLVVLAAVKHTAPASGRDPSHVISATYVCPGYYEPAPLIVLAPDQEVVDKNGNFIVCVKGAQGSNENFDGKDDKTPKYMDDIL